MKMVFIWQHSILSGLCLRKLICHIRDRNAPNRSRSYEGVFRLCIFFLRHARGADPFLPGFASEGDASEVGLAVLLALVLLLLVATRGFLPVDSILFISALLISA